jgi:superfamily II DNA/RNA helicase
MPFKKLVPALKDNLIKLQINEPTAFQKLSIPVVKSGVNMFGIAKEAAGKTTSLIINTIHQLKGRAIEDSPRAIIYVANKEAALDLELEFKKFTNDTDLRVYCVYEEAKLQDQMDKIYPGVDIIISTTKRFNQIYFQNGVHLGQLELLVIEDAKFLIKGEQTQNIIRILQSVERCQVLVYSDDLYPYVERFKETLSGKTRLVRT